MYDAPIIPLPPQNDFLVRLEIPKRKNGKRESVLFVLSIRRRRCGLRSLAYHGSKDGVGSAPATNPSGLVTSDACIERHVDRRRDEMHERLWHAEMGVDIERVFQVRARGDDGGDVGRDERRRRDRLGCMQRIGRWKDLMVDWSGEQGRVEGGGTRERSKRGCGRGGS